MYTNTESYFDAEFNIAPSDNLWELPGIWMAVETPDPSGCNQINRDIQQARYALKRYILQHPDKPQAFWEAFTAVYGHISRKGSVTKDSWSGELYRYGRPTTAEKLLCQLEDAIGISSKLSSEAFYRKLDTWLEYRQFNPIQHYLRDVDIDNPEDLPEWDSLAMKLFGTDDPLSQQMLERTLIAAVARALEPGCQADTALVIKGDQGIGKTSLLRALFGQHFATLHSHQDMLEVQRQLPQFWAMELGELEGITSTKAVERLKAFLSETYDIFRNPYAKTATKNLRHCVFFGTANTDDILTDNSGNRRFWIIDAGSYQIPSDWVLSNKDLIWATAYRKYRQNPVWWFDKELQKQSEERNKDFKVDSPFTDPVTKLISYLEEQYADGVALNIGELMLIVLGIPYERQKVGKADRQVATILKDLGYEVRQLKRQRFYCKTGNPVILTIDHLEKAKSALASES